MSPGLRSWAWALRGRLRPAQADNSYATAMFFCEADDSKEADMCFDWRMSVYLSRRRRGPLLHVQLLGPRDECERVQSAGRVV